VIEYPASTARGCSIQLTTAISKLNLNIASAHVATFGERAVDVFYVTDLLGAQIIAPTAAGVDQARARTIGSYAKGCMAGARALGRPTARPGR
jgi:UTP:GlnB (protein PII) uridylyltransferase